MAGHIHHIQTKYLIGVYNSPDNLTPPISVALHAALHEDLYKHFGNTEDFIAWKGLLGESLKGIRFTPEVRKKISDAGRRKHLPITEETRKKMSESHKGKSSPKKGKKCSEDSKKQMSLSKIGTKRTEETRKKISQTLKGRKLSPEHIKNRTLAQKGKSKKRRAK